MLQAVLFDIDDTLFDREAAQQACFERMLAVFPELALQSPRDRLRRAWTESDQLSTAEYTAGNFDRASRSRHFLRLAGLPPDRAAELTRFYLEVYPTLDTPVAGARELLVRLRLRCKLGVVSNSYPDVQYGKLRSLGLDSLLSCVILSQEVGRSKPDPAVFYLAARRLEVSPSACLFVGDSYTADVVGAKAAGMLACWLNTGAQPLPPDSVVRTDGPVRPDFIIRTLAQLLPLLEQAGLII